MAVVSRFILCRPEQTGSKGQKRRDLRVFSLSPISSPQKPSKPVSRPIVRALPCRETRRRECLDHAIVFGERHLKQLMSEYRDYYNNSRTHLSPNKDSPNCRPAVTRSEGEIVAISKFSIMSAPNHIGSHPMAPTIGMKIGIVTMMMEVCSMNMPRKSTTSCISIRMTKG